MANNYKKEHPMKTMWDNATKKLSTGAIAGGVKDKKKKKKKKEKPLERAQRIVDDATKTVYSAKAIRNAQDATSRAMDIRIERQNERKKDLEKTIKKAEDALKKSREWRMKTTDALGMSGPAPNTKFKKGKTSVQIKPKGAVKGTLESGLKDATRKLRKLKSKKKK